MTHQVAYIFRKMAVNNFITSKNKDKLGKTTAVLVKFCFII